MKGRGGWEGNRGGKGVKWRGVWLVGGGVGCVEELRLYGSWLGCVGGDGGW